MSRMITKHPLNEGQFIVPMTWQMSGYIVVNAANAQEAYKKSLLDEEDYPLPYDSEYVDGSFAPSYEDAEEAEIAITQMTEAYNQGKLNILLDVDCEE